MTLTTSCLQRFQQPSHSPDLAQIPGLLLPQLILPVAQCTMINTPFALLKPDMRPCISPAVKASANIPCSKSTHVTTCNRSLTCTSASSPRPSLTCSPLPTAAAITALCHTDQLLIPVTCGDASGQVPQHFIRAECNHATAHLHKCQQPPAQPDLLFLAASRQLPKPQDQINATSRSCCESACHSSLTCTHASRPRPSQTCCP
jgi:hypothetical protein